MIHHTTPQLDAARIDQMIHTATSYKQERKRRFLPDFLSDMQTRLRFGLGASLAAASILGILWLGPVAPARQQPSQTIAYGADISDMLLYDLMEDLS